ncbi:MAG: PqqD family protein [Chloroflexi bacterium]|nr:PqqD family protein [Chloroflexota bacterium]
MMITHLSRVRLGADVLFRELGGEAILLNMTTGRYYGLDAVGTRMWSLLSEHGQIGPALQGLLQEYDAGEEQVSRDLLAFVEKLAAQQLVEIDAA